MIKRIIGIIISITIAFPVYGIECVKPVQYIEGGIPAPCTGYLFSPEKESELYRINEENKLYKELIPKLETKNDLTTMRLDLYRNYAHEAEKELRAQQMKSDVMKVVYFLSGALLMYGTYKVVNANGR